MSIISFSKINKELDNLVINRYNFDSVDIPDYDGNGQIDDYDYNAYTYDKNHDGKLDLIESKGFNKFLEDNKVLDYNGDGIIDDYDKGISKYDKNHDGKLGIMEKMDLRRALKIPHDIDYNGNGRIDDYDRKISEFDKNHDGKLSRSEQKSLIKFLGNPKGYNPKDDSSSILGTLGKGVAIGAAVGLTADALQRLKRKTNNIK